MKSYQHNRLSNTQKWQLAVGIVFIYLPTRVYVNNTEISWVLIQSKAPLWAVELLVNILFFRIWIDIIEIIESCFDWIDNRIRFKLPSRLIAFLFGVGLAIQFNFAFVRLWVKMHEVFKTGVATTIVRTPGERNYFVGNQRTKFNTGLTVMAMLATFYLVSNRKIFLKMQQLHLDAERLERENLQAQLLVLKNQVSPHFLFNNFSILSSLIESDPQKSIIFLNRLSRSYRYILEQPNAEKIKLRAELEFIETYTFLLKSRFEEKLQVVIDIPEAYYNQYMVAPLTLQLLIENAVKHNQMSDENPLKISICTEQDYLVVCNPIRLRSYVETSTGLGLENILNRYKLLTYKEVQVSNNKEHFTVKIPLLT